LLQLPAELVTISTLVYWTEVLRTVLDLRVNSDLQGSEFIRVWTNSGLWDGVPVESGIYDSVVATDVESGSQACC